MSARVRARHMQVFLAQADATVGLRERFRRTLPRDDLDAIEKAPPVAWLPAEVNLRATHAAMDLLHDDEAEDFFREFMLQDFEKPFLKGIVKMATGLFGLEVTSFLKMVPRGFGQIFDGAASVSAGDSGEAWATLEYRDVAPLFMDDGGRWAQSVEWSMTSLLAVSKREGSVQTTRFAPELRRITYRFEWTAKR